MRTGRRWRRYTGGARVAAICTANSTTPTADTQQQKRNTWSWDSYGNDYEPGEHARDRAEQRANPDVERVMRAEVHARRPIATGSARCNGEATGNRIDAIATALAAAV